MNNHSMRKSKEYKIWLWMKTICYNKNNISYKTYGKRGVKMRASWKKRFMSFYNDMGELPKNDTGIELIDLACDFSKKNCRWVNSISRRKLINMPNQKKRSKKYINPRKIVLTVEWEYFILLKKLSIKKSKELGVSIPVAELIKIVLQEALSAKK